MGKVIQENASKGRTSVLASGKMGSKAKIMSMIEKAEIDTGTSRWCSGQESTCRRSGPGSVSGLGRSHTARSS